MLTVCSKLKPCLLLSNCCHIHVSYTSISLCLQLHGLSLNSWLTKSRVLFVILEGNLHSGLTSVCLVHNVSRVSQEPETTAMIASQFMFSTDCQCSSQNAFLELHSSSSARPVAQAYRSRCLSTLSLANSRY